MDYYLIGSRIKELRLKRGMTQEQLAEKADISTNFLACIEIGKRKGSFETYSNIVDILDSSLDYITQDNIKSAKLNMLKKEMNEIFESCGEKNQKLIVRLAKEVRDSERDGGV